MENTDPEIEDLWTHGQLSILIGKKKTAIRVFGMAGGADEWVVVTAEVLGLESSLRPRGRPDRCICGGDRTGAG